MSAVVATTTVCEVILEGGGFSARCIRCDWARGLTASKATARQWAQEHDEECRASELANRPGDLDEATYERLFSPPDPYQPDPFGAAAASWDELDCGGVWDGSEVTSDADPGL